MNIFDEILKQQHRAEARANALADEIIAALEAARADMTAQLAALRVRFLTAATWQEESLVRRKTFLEAQRAEVGRLIAQIYNAKATDVLSAALDAMGHVQTKTSAYARASGIVFDLHSPRLDLATVQAWAEGTTIEGLVMYEWLERMAQSSAKEVLGKTRFELLRSGKITLDLMVVDGRVKKLSELNV